MRLSRFRSRVSPVIWQRQCQVSNRSALRTRRGFVRLVRMCPALAAPVRSTRNATDRSSLDERRSVRDAGERPLPPLKTFTRS